METKQDVDFRTIAFIVAVLIGICIYVGFGTLEKIEIKKQEVLFKQAEIEYVKEKIKFLKYQDSIQKRKVIMY